MHCPQPQLLAFVCLFVCSQNRFCAKTISSVDLWVGGWAHPQTSTDIISLMLQGLNLLIASFTFLSYMSYVGQPDAAHSGIYYWWCVSLDCIQFRNVANTVVRIFFTKIKSPTVAAQLYVNIFIKIETIAGLENAIWKYNWNPIHDLL